MENMSPLSTPLHSKYLKLKLKVAMPNQNVHIGQRRNYVKPGGANRQSMRASRLSKALLGQHVGFSLPHLI